MFYIDLIESGSQVEQQKRFHVNYKGKHIDTLVPDLILDNTFIVDTKVVSEFNETHITQMIGYLAITDLKLALLLSFKNIELNWKRVVRS